VDSEVLLPQGRGGSKVWRSDRGVHRDTGPWTPTVHAYLRHLEIEGFEGAPRVLGLDDHDREVLTFIEGDVLSDPLWQPGEPGPWPDFARSEDALAAAASMLRRLHDAARSFRPVSPVWKQYDWPLLLDGEIVCHGDIGKHNTVYRHGLPVAFIDWDAIRPNRPILEFATAAWKYVPLATDEYFAASAFSERPDLPRRLALFAEAYGVTDRATVLGALQQAKQRSLEAMRFWPVTAGDAATFVQLVANDLSWLAGAESELGRSLTP